MPVVALDASNASMRFVIFSSLVFVPCAGTQGGLLLTLKLHRPRVNRNIRLIPRQSPALPERSFSFYRNLVRRSAIHPRRKFTTAAPFLKLGCGIPAPLPLGESGASSIKGRVRAARSAAWMPLTETGRSPGTNSAGISKPSGVARLWPDPASVRGQPTKAPPHDGVRGTVVQADSTWFSERLVVRSTATVADLTVPVVRAAVVRQAVEGPRSIGYAAFAATAGPPNSN